MQCLTNTAALSAVCCSIGKVALGVAGKLYDNKTRFFSLFFKYFFFLVFVPSVYLTRRAEFV